MINKSSLQSTGDYRKEGQTQLTKWSQSKQISDSYREKFLSNRIDHKQNGFVRADIPFSVFLLLEGSHGPVGTYLKI